MTGLCDCDCHKDSATTVVCRCDCTSDAPPERMADRPGEADVADVVAIRTFPTAEDVHRARPWNKRTPANAKRSLPESASKPVPPGGGTKQ